MIGNNMERRRSSLCGLLVAISAASVMLVEETHAAAIPMWEYLSKDEKMSYLYSMFANQVEDFCEFSDMRDCNRELLRFGLGKLKDMPEDHLDTMDPYQRGAHTLIWDSMMEGHEMMDKTKNNDMQKRVTTSKPKPNSYEDDQFGFKPTISNGGVDYQSAASAKIESVVYRLPPPKGFVITSGPSQYVHPKGGYVQGNTLQLANTANRYQAAQEAEVAPLTGPMVVRVHLDGSPVQEGHTQLPQDEDLKQYKMSKARIPTF